MPEITTYEVLLSTGYKFRFAANLVEARCPLYAVDEDGEYHITQYQTADARHRESTAAELMLSLEDGLDDEVEIVSVRVCLIA